MRQKKKKNKTIKYIGVVFVQKKQNDQIIKEIVRNPIVSECTGKFKQLKPLDKKCIFERDCS